MGSETLPKIDQALYLAIDKRRESCEDSFYTFVKYFWDIVISEPMIDNWHIEYLCDEIQEVMERVFIREPKLYDLLINVPPGSSKSTICSVMLNAWAWCRDPSLRFLTGSFKTTIAVRDCVKSREIVKSSKFRELWPEKIRMVPDMDLKTEYRNTEKGSRNAFSVEGGIIGEHGHVISLDDPLNAKKRASEKEKENAIDVLKSLSTRKVDKEVSVIVMIMQRLAQDDPAGYWLDEHTELKHICLPSELTDLNNVKPVEAEGKYIDGLLDPVRGSRLILDKLKKELGSKDYSGQGLQHPEAIGGTIFERDKWRYYEDLPLSMNNMILHSWDTDFGKKAANTGGVFGLLHETGLYLTAISEESLKFPQLDAEIRMRHSNKPAHAILIEDKASGQSEIQVLEQETDLPVVKVNPVQDKVTRAYNVTPYIEAGNVYLPINEPWTKPFVDLLSAYPDIKKNRMDVVDALTQLIDYCRKGPSAKATITTKKRKTRTVKGF